MERRNSIKKQYVSKPLLQRLSHENNVMRPPSSMPHNLIAIDTLYEDIRRNLEAILNARLRYIKIPIAFTELRESLINYGLSDFMHSSFGSKATQKQLCLEIKNIINYFEPRITAVQVHLKNLNEDISRVLEIRIEGNIKALDNNIPAVFESFMDLNKHNFNFE